MAYSIPVSELIKDVPDELLKSVQVPPWLKYLLVIFGVSDLRSYWDEHHLIYEGRLRLLIPKERISLPLGKWRFIVTVLDEGLPFTLWVERRTKDGATTLADAEPADRAFKLLLQLSTLTIQFDPEVVKPGRLRTEPHITIEPVEGGDAPRLTLPQVSLLLDSKDGLIFTACQSWEDLTERAESFILQTQLTPRYVTILDAVGLGLDRVVVDLNATRTPPAVQRIPGHGPSWQGVYLDELLICAPLRMPRMSFATRAQDFLIGLDGKVSGRFTAEFAKDYAISDGRLKFKAFSLHDQSGKALESLDTPAGVREYLLTAAKGPSAKAQVKATVTGAKKGEKLVYEVRLDGKRATQGQSAAADDTGAVSLETALFEVGEGTHELGLFVAQEPPAPSGVRYATRLSVTFTVDAFQDASVRVTVTRPGQPGFEAASDAYVEGVVPLHIAAEHPVRLPPGHRVRRTWTLAEARSGGTPQATERFAATVHLAGDYVLTLDYDVEREEGAGTWQRVTQGKRQVSVKLHRSLGDRALDDVYLSSSAGGAFQGRTVTVRGFPGKANLEAKLRTYEPPRGDLEEVVAQKKLVWDVLSGLRPEERVPAVDYVRGSPPEIRVPVVADKLSVLEVEVQRTQARDQTAFLLDVAACFGLDKKRSVTAEGKRQAQAIAEHLVQNQHVRTVTFWVHDLEVLTRGQTLKDALAAVLTDKAKQAAMGFRHEVSAGGLEAQFKKGDRTITVRWRDHSAQPGQQLPADPDKNTVVAVLEGDASIQEKATRRLVALPMLPIEERRPALPVLPTRPPLFESSWFRRLRVELDLLRNEITKGQVEVVADLFDVQVPHGPKVEIDDVEGLVRFVAGVTRDPVSERLRIESSYRADPRDKNGLFPFRSTVRNEALSWLRLYFFALPPAAAISKDAVTRVVATAVAAGLASTLRALPSASKPGDPKRHALEVTDVRMQAFHLRVETGRGGQDVVVVAADYDCLVALDFALAGFKLQTKAKKPIELQYRNVGFLFGGEKGFDFFYEPAKGFAIDVKDTGVLELPGWAKSLLSLKQLRLGIGSPLTLDVTLGLKQDLGLIKLSSLPLHVAIDPEAPDPKSRLTVDVGAIRAGIEIPDVLSGSGMILIKDKKFLGSLNLKLARPKFTIEADLALSFQDDYTAIYAAIYAEWGVGVPLANSGAALYGLAGLFGMHYGRKKLPRDAYQWYVAGPAAYSARAIEKWEERRGNLAFGAGVVIGTLTDGGRALNLKGMLILELPGPRFLLAMRANLLKGRPKVKGTEKGTIAAVVDLDFEEKRFLIKLAVRYEIEKVLKLQVPAEAFFELPSEARAGSYHIWIGHDKKKELQVRLTVFEFLEAWGYLMIQSAKIENLAGTGATLPGPCIAFGLHAELKLGDAGDPIYLLAYVDLHVGLGLAPIFFYGMARIGGKIHLLVVGLGVWANLQAQASEADGFSMEGKLCGYVELLFWKLEGCFSFKLGAEPTFSDPESALDSLTFRHRATGLPLSMPPSAGRKEREAVVGKVYQSSWTDADWKALHPVPIDGVPILQFRTGVNYDKVKGCFDLQGNPPAKRYREEISDRLAYEHTLLGLHLSELKNGREIPITGVRYPAAWPLGQKERLTTLQLNEWKPILDWTLQEHTARAEVPGYVQAICAPTPPAKTVFYGFNEQPEGPGEIWHLRPSDRPHAPMVTVRCAARSALSAALMQAGHGTYGRARVIKTPSPLPPRVPDARRVLCLPLDGSSVEIDTRGLRDVQLYLAGDVDQWLGQVSVDGRRVYGTEEGGVWHAQLEGEGRVVVELSGEGMGAIVTETLRAIYLVALSGLAAAEWDVGERRERQREEAQHTWQHRLDHGTGEGALLKPGTRYVLQIDLAWTRHAYRGEERKLSKGTGKDVVNMAFRTADAVPVSLADYVEETLPSERAEAHYYEEPLLVRFKTASIHQHVRQYQNRRFVIFAKSERGVAHGDLSLPQLHRTTIIEEDVEAALVAALHQSSCLHAPRPVASLAPTVNLTYQTRFQPNTGYTAYVASLPDAPGLTDLTPAELAERALKAGIEHYRWPFTTSRYATFSEHVMAHEGFADWILRDAPAADYGTTIEQALGRVANTPQERRGDAVLEQLLYDILRCEAMPPADEPMGYRLWLRTDGAQGPTWKCLGLLLDSPEPLLRAGCTGVALNVGAAAQRTARAFALAVNTRGTRALLWSPGLRGDPIDVTFSLTKPALPPDDKERIESATLQTYVWDKPGAYQEEN